MHHEVGAALHGFELEPSLKHDDRTRGQTVSQHGVEDVDHLPITVVSAGKPALDRSSAAGSSQSLKGAPLRKAPGLRASTGT